MEHALALVNAGYNADDGILFDRDIMTKEEFNNMISEEEYNKEC